MQFKFEANQEFQLQAIEAVCKLFEGQPRAEDAGLNSALAGYGAIANRLDLDGAAVLANLKTVQAENGLTADPELQYIGDPWGKNGHFANFSVEMETGTGKTYVYIRTALELYRRYGMRKFIVVVPSVAIREGVYKTLQVTEKHLRELYGNLPYRYYIYSSDNLSQIRSFALSNNVEFMVMTIDSFNKASNILHQSTDRLQGEMPVNLVRAASPILILDEPQNMESKLSKEALLTLNPLFALRYSATHRNPYNLVYRLTPFEAYRQGLVKKIEVAGVEKDVDANKVYLRLDGIKAEKETLRATLMVHKLMAGGMVKEQQVTVRYGDNLEEKTGLQEYAPFTVDEINAGFGIVSFSNGVELSMGESLGADKEAVFRAQIRYTVEQHLRKQERYKPHGIKVLSLFFIDRVDNYAPEDGLIRRLFYEAFEELKAKHPGWQHLEAGKVQASYFAASRKKGGAIEFLDSKTGESEKDREAYDLIMKDKERLLSFEEPVSFIFSHSALREGWDNPNIFQICTLNQTTSEVKKRQEIGRGVRLSVDQAGNRVHDEKLNVLTVVANESYESYVEGYQSEIEQEYGKDGLAPKPANARARATSKLRKFYFLKPEFKELWDRISRRTRYAVKIDSEKLIKEVLADLDRRPIPKPQIHISTGILTVEDTDQFGTMHIGEKKADAEPERIPLPNVIEVMANLMERTTPPLRLTRQTLLEIFSRSGHRLAALENPYGFALTAVEVIKHKLAQQLIDGIRYEKIDDWYEMTQFAAEIEGWEDNLLPASRSLYTMVEFDSEIERQFAEGLEQRQEVKLYAKLPKWFRVQTPVGDYVPDWAIIWEPRDEFGAPKAEPMLYLVRETKSTKELDDLRPDEARKIECGKRHFQDALAVDFKVATSAKDLPGI